MLGSAWGMLWIFNRGEPQRVMPGFDITIYQDPDYLHVRFIGRTTVDDILAGYEGIYAHPDYRPRMDGIVDFTLHEESEALFVGRFGSGTFLGF